MKINFNEVIGNILSKNTDMINLTYYLGKVLPKDYRMALEIMKRVGADLGEKFEYMFFPDFVEVYGLD
ncbi:MAG: hypothetical protein ACI97N_000359, partial [Cognaticolwellia sp.]